MVRRNSFELRDPVSHGDPFVFIECRRVREQGSSVSVGPEAEKKEIETRQAVLNPGRKSRNPPVCSRAAGSSVGSNHFYGQLIHLGYLVRRAENGNPDADVRFVNPQRLEKEFRAIRKLLRASSCGTLRSSPKKKKTFCQSTFDRNSSDASRE